MGGVGCSPLYKYIIGFVETVCCGTSEATCVHSPLLLPPLSRYNPEHDNESRLLRHRACELQDAAHSFMDRLLNEDFDKLCEELKESSQRLGLPSHSTHHHTPALGDDRGGWHGDGDLDTEDDDMQELYCRRSLRQQGVEAPVEGLSYYGPRRGSRKRTIEDGESDVEGEGEVDKGGEIEVCGVVCSC